MSIKLHGAYRNQMIYIILVYILVTKCPSSWILDPPIMTVDIRHQPVRVGGGFASENSGLMGEWNMTDLPAFL